ncbi:unnamed protein product [Prorocentrum cordatum]|uniref:Uncharacterized protein n=1 Tax=Prorocentrum cordatum TaxID=2364126 RepID=A0ABN9TCN5_9DINO|nr:unnamed protein product [Polarella glacialis]
MVRMVDDLKRRVRTMEPTELIQCVSAAARVKFYDRTTFLQDLLMPHIRSHLRNKKRVPFTTDELLTTLCSLSDLNCFDQVIFDGIVRELANKRSKELGCPQWAALLAAFKKVNYTCDEDKEFYEWMRVSLKAERYEIASAEQRMIVGNSKQGMHAPEGYLRSFMVGTMNNGVEVRRPQGLTS